MSVTEAEFRPANHADSVRLVFGGERVVQELVCAWEPMSRPSVAELQDALGNHFRIDTASSAGRGPCRCPRRA